MPDRLLIVEDEPLVRDLLVLNLSHEGYQVAFAANFEDGLAKIVNETPDMAVVDVMLPGGDGFSLTRQARDKGVRCPVLILTARSDKGSIVRGLDCGADDYLTKPFDLTELFARVRALLRRAKGAEAQSVPRLELGRFWVRLDTGQALTNEGEVTLSDKELRLIEFFSRSEERLLTRADILEEVWGMDAFPTDRTVDNFVLRLRRLFEPDPDEPVHFLTVRGRGYLFRRKA